MERVIGQAFEPAGLQRGWLLAPGFELDEHHAPVVKEHAVRLPFLVLARELHSDASLGLGIGADRAFDCGFSHGWFVGCHCSAASGIGSIFIRSF